MKLIVTFILGISFQNVLAQDEILRVGDAILESVRFSKEEFSIRNDSIVNYQDYSLTDMNGEKSDSGNWRVYFKDGKEVYLVWILDESHNIDFIINEDDENIIIPRMIRKNNGQVIIDPIYGIIYRLNNRLFVLTLEGLVKVSEELIVGSDTVQSEVQQFGNYVKSKKDRIFIREIISLRSNLTINKKYYFSNNYLSSYSTFSDYKESIYLLSNGSCVSNVTLVPIDQWLFSELSQVEKTCYSTLSVDIKYPLQEYPEHIPLWLRSDYFSEFSNLETFPIPEK